MVLSIESVEKIVFAENTIIYLYKYNISATGMQLLCLFFPKNLKLHMVQQYCIMVLNLEYRSYL